MSLAALTNALSGLKTSQRALGVISDNIANANTEGYVRKVVDQSSVVLDGRGAGVEIGRISRVVDEYLMRERRENIGELRAVEQLETYFNEIQDLFGQPADNNSIASLTERLQTALSNYEINPEDAFRAQQVVDAAENLAARMNDMHYTLQDLRARADIEIGDDVTEINLLLQQIDDFNVDIIRTDAKGQDASGMRDKRDVALNKLAELVDITYWENSDGAVSITTSGGKTLLDVDPLTVFHDVPNGLRADIAFDPDRVVADPDLGTIRGILVGGLDEQNDITSELRRGSIKGLVDLRDEILPSLVSELDELTRELRDGINAMHNLGAAFPPPNALNGQREFLDFSTSVTGAPLTGDEVAFNGTGVIRMTVVQANPPAQRGNTVSTFNVDLDQIRELELNDSLSPTGVAGFEKVGVAGTLTVEDVRRALQAQLDATGALGTVTFPDGKLAVTLNNTDQGVIIDAPKNVAASNIFVNVNATDPVGGLINGDTFQILGENAATLGVVTVSDVDVDGNLSLADIARAINDETTGVPGVTARVQAYRDGTVAPPGSTAYRLEITADDGQTITVDDLTGTPAQTLGLVNGAGATNTLNAVAGSTDLLAGEPTVQFMESKSFANPTVDLSKIDQIRTPTTAQTLTISTADGGTAFSQSFTLTSTSLQDVVNEINNSFTTPPNPVITARLVNVDGWKIELSAADGSDISVSGDLATTLGFDEQRFGFSHYFGLNDFYAYSENFSASSDMKVRAGIAEDPNLLIRADPVNSITVADPATGTLASTAITSGNNEGLKAMAESMITGRTFDAAGDLPEITLTFSEYATRILSNQAVKASLNGDDLQFREDVVGELSFRLEGIQGVNIDEELSNLILYQNAYTAAARVISASQELLDELVNITR